MHFIADKNSRKRSGFVKPTVNLQRLKGHKVFN